MENHPVPQNISSYEFHLVGDMTLKQFLQLAGGIVVGYIFFTLPILPIIKFPLAGLSVLIGVLMAFVPINGRPFSSWLGAFVKAIYSPTEFVWVPDELIATQVAAVAAPAPAVIQTPVQTTSPAPTIPAPTQTDKIVRPEATKILPSFSDFLSSKKPPSDGQVHSKETTITHLSPAQQPPPQTEVKLAPAIPPSHPTSTIEEAGSAPNLTPQTNPTSDSSGSTSLYTSASQFPKSSPIVSAPAASITSQISAPTQPNILTGLIVDSDSLPVPQITIEVIDIATGIPARALRTNKLGQFQIAIPLPAGSYNVIPEKDGLKFDPVSIQIKGGIIPPVIIQAKKT